MKIHVVESGDSLYQIAQCYGLPMSQLLSDNQLPHPNHLAIGQALILRFPKVHYTVAQGDTLASISHRHDMTVRQLLRNNPALMGRYQIFPGQSLVLAYEDNPTREIVSYGYAYPSIDRQQYQAILPYLTAVAPFTHPVAEGGQLEALTGGQEGWMVETASQMGTRPVLHVSTLLQSGFSADRSRQVLTSQEARSRLISQIVEEASQSGYGGVDLDFESVYGQDAQAYARFVADLHSALAPYNIPVIVALAPKTSSDQRGETYEGHDYSLLGEGADKLLLMTYEWGYTYSEPRAVAPIHSVRQVVDYAVSQIPSEKLLLGIPNYGYDWTLPHVQGNRARSISCQEAVTLAVQNRVSIRYDEGSQTPWFRYADQYGVQHEVWFEDVRSITAKLKLVEEFQLGGVGYWNLDRPFPQTYVLLNGTYIVKDSR